MKSFLRLSWASVILGLALPLRAQQADNPVYYTVALAGYVDVMAQGQPYYGGFGATLVDAEGNVVGAGAGGGDASTPPPYQIAGYSGLAKLLPNKDYTLSVSGALFYKGSVVFRLINGGAARVLVAFAPGEVVHFDGSMVQGTTVTHTFKVRIELPRDYPLEGASTGMRGGEASSIVADKPIWYLGLGKLRSGKTAGAVGFRAADFTATGFFTPAALYYESPDQTEVQVTLDSLTSALSAIEAREVKVAIQPLTTTSYELAVTSRLVDGSWASSPFVTYTVSSINNGNGVGIARVEDGITWETSLGLSGSTWTFRDWHLPSAPDSYLTTEFSTPMNAVMSRTGPSATGTSETVALGNKIFTQYIWGKELQSTAMGVLSTEQTYYPATAADGYQGKLDKLVRTDGSWSKYVYYASVAANNTPGQALGALKGEFKPWLDGPTSPDSATAANSVYTAYTYDSFSSELVSSAIATAPNGNLLSKTEWLYGQTTFTSNSVDYSLRTITQKDYWNATEYLTTTTKQLFAGGGIPLYFSEKPISVARPDGAKDSYAYFSGTWNSATKSFAGNTAGEDRLVMVFHGQTAANLTSPTGSSITGWTNGYTWSLDSLYMVPNHSTVTQAVIDRAGRQVFTGEYVYVSTSSLALVSGTVFGYDDHGRLYTETDAVRSGVVTTRTYLASLPVTVTAPDGVITRFTHDGLLRRTEQIEGHLGPSLYPAKTEQTLYDAANRPVQTFTCSCGTSPTSYVYDSSGRLDYKTEPSPYGGTLTTDYSYPSVRITTTTLPTGAVRTEETYLDGRSKSIIGTAQFPVAYTYSAETTGLKFTQQNGSTLANGWTETQYDLLGRTVQQSTPGWGWSSSGGNQNKVVDVVSTYDPSHGYLVDRSTTDRVNGGALLPVYRYAYNAAGEVMKEGLDVDGVSGLTPESANDRIKIYDRYFANDGGWTRVATISTCATTGSATTSQLAATITRLTDFSSGAIAEVKTTDATGRTTTQKTFLYPTDKRSRTEVSITGSSAAGFSETINGYQSTIQSLDGNRVSREYDSRGRLWRVKSRWDGSNYGATDTYAYHGDTEFVASLATGGVTSTYAYEWGSGRKVTTTVGGVISYAVYNELDRPWRTYGPAASPTEMIYDALGRVRSLTTWRSGSFIGPDWPSSPGAGDITQWTPDPATGLINRKTYADTTHVDYTYTALGQIGTRTSARGIVTTYEYYDGSTTSSSDPSHRTQELKSVSYTNDPAATPSVTYTYKRSGLPAGVADRTGARTFAYRSTNPFQLETETLGAFYGNRVRTLTYDSDQRPTGFQLGTSGDSDADLAQTVDFVPESGLLYHLYSASNNGAARTFTYGYVTNSARVDNYATGSFSALYGYDSTSAARRTKVEAQWSGTPLTRFDLTHDNRGLVQSAKQSGSGFADYSAGTSYSSVFNYYAYSGRGEVASAAMYRGAPSGSAPAPADELPGRRFEYRYDAIGNRQTAGPTGTAAGGDEEYVLKDNGLNQYDTKENNTVRILGTAAVGAAVAVTDATVNKKDRSFAADLVPGTHGSSPATGQVTAYAAVLGAGASDPDLVGSQLRSWQIAQQRQTFTYDLDGNLENDGVWSYAYDAENRLIRMASTAGALAAGLPSKVLEFKYDAMGRRVQKRSNNVTLGTDVYTGYVYDGWNVVAEFSVNTPTTSPTCGTLRRSFTWGLDLAGSTNATGGVGALVQIADHTASKTYYPTYDGTGNVAALVDSADGSLAAVYEYSPFGELLRGEGAYAAANPFRFSTKWTDTESGLSYYGLRYYSPGMGRFINRDPIEEQGGINLYGFVGNNPVNAVDVLGMWHFDGVSNPGNPPSGQWVPDPGDILPPYQVTSSKWESPWESIIRGSAIDRPNFADSYPRWNLPIFQIVTSSSTGNGSGKMAPKKEWTPNKSDCDALRAKYPNALVSAGSPTDIASALASATVAVGAATQANRFEYDSIVYKLDGKFAYSDPIRFKGVPTRVGNAFIPSPVRGEVVYNNPAGTERVAVAHGHDLGYQTYRDWAIVMERQPPTMDDYLLRANRFSDSDVNSTAAHIGIISVSTPAGGILFHSWSVDGPAGPHGAPGRPIPGAPQGDDAIRLQACINAKK